FSRVGLGVLGGVRGALSIERVAGGVPPFVRRWRAPMLACTALVAVSCIASPVYAADTNWTNTVGNKDWFNDSNWDNNKPTSGDNALLTNGATAGIPAQVSLPRAPLRPH